MHCDTVRRGGGRKKKEIEKDTMLIYNNEPCYTYNLQVQIQRLESLE